MSAFSAWKNCYRMEQLHSDATGPIELAPRHQLRRLNNPRQSSNPHRLAPPSAFFIKRIRPESSLAAASSVDRGIAILRNSVLSQHAFDNRWIGEAVVAINAGVAMTPSASYQRSCESFRRSHRRRRCASLSTTLCYFTICSVKA